MEDRDLPAPFDAAVVADVTRDRPVGAGRLTALLAAHQAAVADLPGAENLMYEWRKQYRGARLHRTETAYYAMVPETVWPEFGEAIDADAEERSALRLAHERQVATTLDRDDPPDGQTYVVLVRP